MSYFKPTADASDQYRPSASSATPAFTPTAVEGNVSHFLRAGVTLGQPIVQQVEETIELDTAPAVVNGSW